MAHLYTGWKGMVQSDMPIHMYAADMMKTEALCTEEHAPLCQARCPLHLDVRELCRLLRAGEPDRARALLPTFLALPRITAKRCDGPCMIACRRGDVDAPVNIGALERYLTANPDWAAAKVNPRFRQKHRAAVVGAGASGLTAAAYLAGKGFPVTVYERGPCPGSSLIGQNGVTEADVERDIAPFVHLIDWRVSTEVAGPSGYQTLLADYEAVLVTGGYPGTLRPDPATLQVGERNLFFAGRKLLKNGSFSASLCSGKQAGITMERLMKGVSLTAMRVHEDAYQTDLYTSIEGVTPDESISEHGIYDDKVATMEASRCLDCHCMECVRECVFMQKFERYPRRYIREIANTISLLRDGIRSGKNLMVACSLCGLCGKLCPNGIPMERVVRAGRAAMVQKGELSDAIYDFPLRDMLFSNGEEAALCRHAPGKQKSRRVFFPGCQLAASAPETVLKTYAYLLEREPETGVLLGCCGAPADWSGRERLYGETVGLLAERLHSLGDPEVICACPTCLKQLQAAGIPAVSLYPLLAEGPLPEGARRPRAVSVQDSCAARDEIATQSAVRTVLNRCGYAVTELAMSGEKTKCCGYGGLVFYGDREVAGEMIRRRAAESALPYVSYCSVCRDYLARAGKPGVHVLDVFFGDDEASRWTARGADPTEKEENRLYLADELLRRFFGEDRPAKRAVETPLVMDESVRAILEERLLTERCLQMVIANAEATGKKLIRPGDGHYIASLRPGIITYWVEYAKEGPGYRVYNAYSHRVDISEART